MSKENYEEAKKFVLQNCYIDAYNCDCESEVTPFAWNYYKKYPFFNDCEYEIYFPKKGAHRTLTTHKPFFTLEDDAADNLFLGKRRQSTNLGCFASKEKLIIEDNINDEEKEYIVNSWTNFKCLDLSGDIVTSLETVFKKFCNCIYDKNEINLKLQCCDFDSEIIKSFKDIKDSLLKFTDVVGTIGNMMPVPEKTNKNVGENYFVKLYKLKDIYHDQKIPIKNNVFQDNKLLDKKNQYKINWKYFFNKEFKENGWKDFIEGFCLQDYFKDAEYEDLITPCKILDKDNPGYPSKKATIDDWIEWFNCNTCLILKRGARIYSEGDEDLRKKLAVKLILNKRFNDKRSKDEKFNLANWYEKNQEGNQDGCELEKLFD